VRSKRIGRTVFHHMDPRREVDDGIDTRYQRPRIAAIAEIAGGPALVRVRDGAARTRPGDDPVSPLGQRAAYSRAHKSAGAGNENAHQVRPPPAFCSASAGTESTRAAALPPSPAAAARSTAIIEAAWKA